MGNYNRSSIAIWIIWLIQLFSCVGLMIYKVTTLTRSMASRIVVTYSVVKVDFTVPHMCLATQDSIRSAFRVRCRAEEATHISIKLPAAVKGALHGHTHTVHGHAPVHLPSAHCADLRCTGCASGALPHNPSPLVRLARRANDKISGWLGSSMSRWETMPVKTTADGKVRYIDHHCTRYVLRNGEFERGVNECEAEQRRTQCTPTRRVCTCAQKRALCWFCAHRVRVCVPQV